MPARAHALLAAASCAVPSAAVGGAVPHVRLTQGIRPGETVDMPAIGFGTFGYGHCASPTDCAGGEVWNDTMIVPLIEQWIAMGGRRIDGAFSYATQKGMGEGIAAAVARGAVSRGELFVTSKTDIRPNKLAPASLANDTGYKYTLWQFDEILRTTGLTYVDLLLIHWPGDPHNAPADSSCPCAEGHTPGAKGYSLCRREAWRALVELLDAGKVRAIGVSNFEAAHLADVTAGHRPAVNQVEFHPYFHEDELVRLCAQSGVRFQSYSPLGAPDHMSYPGVSNWTAMPAQHSAIRGVAAARGITPAQAILQWAWEAYNVSAQPRTLSAAHMRENLAALGGAPLSAAELAAVSAVAGGAGAPPEQCVGIRCANKVCPDTRDIP